MKSAFASLLVIVFPSVGSLCVQKNGAGRDGKWDGLGGPDGSTADTEVEMWR